MLLSAILGEADILTGQLISPKSPPDAVATFMRMSGEEEWLVPNMCAYVPQVSWYVGKLEK